MAIVESVEFLAVFVWIAAFVTPIAPPTYDNPLIIEAMLGAAHGSTAVVTRRAEFLKGVAQSLGVLLSSAGFVRLIVLPT